MIDTMEQIQGGPVYHFQSKLTAKEPFVGGAWEWHQDYGYWYYNGCLFPDLASCQIALDGSTTANGCLTMIAGSHRLGRIDHVPVPGEGQNVADPARTREILARGCRRCRANWNLVTRSSSTATRCIVPHRTVRRTDAGR